MNGVEILSECSVYTTPAWVAVLGIFTFIGTLIFIVTLVHSQRGITIGINLVCVVICFVTFITLAILDGETNHLKEYSHIEYKVTIDDSVSMNEFLDKYEILDQEGKIYTIKERE